MDKVLALPGNYSLRRDSTSTWWIYQGRLGLALKIVPSLPCGPGGLIDKCVEAFARVLTEAAQSHAECHLAVLCDGPEQARASERATWAAASPWLRHLDSCNRYKRSPECDCGLDSVRAAAQGGAG